MKKWLEIIGIIVLVVLIVYFVGTKPETPINDTNMNTTAKKWDKPPEMKIDQKKKYTAIIDTSKGIMKIDLFASEVPITVNNFVFLAQEKFYDNVVFHRIIKDFMIQSGDPTGTGAGNSGYKFDDEKITRDYKRGTIAMANSGPNTNGSQFFIMDKDNSTLPKNYVIFGAISETDTESFKTLDVIANTPVEANSQGEQSSPKEAIVIKAITIEEK
jgi:peptidylprolyl isomerase